MLQYGEIGFHKAALRGRVEEVKKLVKHGAVGRDMVLLSLQLWVELRLRL